ncbi:MAG: hypothetical protein R3D98_01505 [Candidatus Krumholzibacteriia bacterium]
MTHHDLLRRLTLLLMLGLAIAALSLGCSSVSEPTFENPLDPRNPDSADPFGLVATYADGRVKLQWTVPGGPAIAQIVIESIINSQPTDIDTVAATVTSYLDTAPRGNSENLYRLRALNAAGLAAQTSHVVPAAVFVPPVIHIPDALPGTPAGVKISRAVNDIGVRAVAGDVVQLDTLRDFSTTAALALAGGEAVYEGFRILKPRVNGFASPSRQLYVRAGLVLEDGAEPLWSSVDSLAVEMAIVSTISKTGGGSTVAAPLVGINLTSGGVGIEAVRFAAGPDSLAAAEWRAPAASYADVPLIDTPATQNLIAEFASSFGDLVRSGPLALRGDPLTSVSITPVLPESGLVEGRLVTLAAHAVATEMRLSTDPDFHDGPWQAYADTLDFTVRDEAGEQTIYAQFRNHWFLSGIVSRTVTVSGATLDVAFTGPLDGAAVRGGSSVTLTGRAGPLPDGFALTGMEVNLGAGWQAIAPDTAWTATWDVPLFSVDTPRPLGVRAVAENPLGGDTIEGVAWITVTVSQLTVRITAPLAGADLVTGAVINLRGQATRDLTSVPLDSVVVTVADASFTLLQNLTGWAVAWNAPAVTDTVPTAVTATAHAGEDAVSASVNVRLVPPPAEE